MIKNSKGFTLIEIMIGGAVALTIALAAGTFLVNQIRVQKQLAQWQTADKAKMFMSALFSNPSNCACQFTGKTFDGTLPSTSITGLPQFLASCQAGAPVNYFVGQVLQNGLTISDIRAVNIIATGNSNEFSAQLQMVFDPNSIAGSLPQVSVPIIIEAAGLPTSLSVTSCVGTSITAQGICVSAGGTWNSTAQTCSLNSPTAPCLGVPLPPNGAINMNPASTILTCGGGIVDGTCNQCAPAAGQFAGSWVCGGAGWVCVAVPPPPGPSGP